MSLHNALTELFNEVDNALACAVVDMSNKKMLGLHHDRDSSHLTPAFIDAVAAAAVEMFRGKTIATIEKVMAAHRGMTSKRMLREVQVTSDHASHFIAVVDDKPDALLVLITRRSANLGRVWTAVRRTNAEIAPFCP